MLRLDLWTNTHFRRILHRYAVPFSLPENMWDWADLETLEANSDVPAHFQVPARKDFVIQGSTADGI